jgi:glycosyltransferase involved in cell wall biosynthesis
MVSMSGQGFGTCLDQPLQTIANDCKRLQSVPRLAYLYSRYPVVSQTFCDSEMLALEGMGFELQVVSLNAPPDSFRHERLDRLKAEIHYPAPGDVLEAEARLPEFTQKLGPLIAEHDAKYGKSFKAATRARNAWHFAPILKRLGVSHVHVHFANRATHSALFLKKLGFTFSFTAHAQDFMVDLGSNELLAEMVRESEFTVCVSDFSRALLCQMCPGNDAKVVRIYNGIELDDFPVAQPEHDRDGRLKLVSIGRLIEFKGFQHVVNAAALLKSRGIDVEVSIIGEGPWRGELEPHIEGAGLQDRVKLLGVRSQHQIKRELAEAHAFVLPSIVDRKGASDILPTVITEAMACRLPVVSTKLAGIPEMVADGETGLLVEPGDDRALADAIAKLAGDVALRKRMGEAGRARAERMFALRVTAGEFRSKVSGPMSKVSNAEPQRSPVVALVSTVDEVVRPLKELPVDGRMRVVIADRGADVSDAINDLHARGVEWMPDAVVLESLWQRRSEWRRKMEKLRETIGEAMDGEAFYIQARRAVWLADALPRRGAKHLHAFTSDDIVAVWLWKQLTGLQASVAVEDAPRLSRVVLGRLLADFDVASVSDEKLVRSVNFKLGDSLDLRRPPSHRELRLGPLRIKLRQTAAAVDRKSLERAWLDQILATLHV